MNVPRDDRSVASPLLTELAELLIRHLDAEAAALREAVGTLESLHRSLREADLEALRAAQGQQHGLADRLDQLREVRGELVRAIGDALRTAPEGLTARGLSTRLPADLARRLEDAREQTHRLACRVDSLNQQNAVLTAHCLGYVQGCLADLYGESAVAPRYSRAGQAIEAPRGSLVEVQG